MEEEWRDVVGFEDTYEISNLGKVRSKDRIIKYSDGRIIHRKSFIKKPTYTQGGYPRIGLQVNGKLVMKFVHRLVAEAFIPNPNNYPIINHKDDTGRKCMGEKYDMLMAKEVCERYRGMMPSSVTYSDVYIAINSQYHDYHCLFKKWFGEDIDYKIIESAVRYWFKDEDYGSSKLWDHFKDK